MDKRILSLDFLRGIAASIVMCGHYYVWFGAPTSPPITLLKFITYSVSIFYVLSGITLYSVYNRSFQFNFQSFVIFAIKRIFRILPLLWIATTLTIIITDVSPTLRLLFYNYTGLFGFIPERDGIARAAWSIGNEMIFYMFFPLYILMLKFKWKVLFYVAMLASLVPAIYISFIVIDPAKTPATEFTHYIHPLNQLFLFVFGIWVAYKFARTNVNITFIKILLLFFFIAFILFPITRSIDIFAGVERMALCLICIVICTCIYKLQYDNLSPIIEKPLAFLGETSYSIYLLHPIIYRLMIDTFDVESLPVTISMFLCILPTLVASYLVYQFIEKPAMNLGKIVSRRIFN